MPQPADSPEHQAYWQPNADSKDCVSLERQQLKQLRTPVDQWIAEVEIVQKESEDAETGAPEQADERAGEHFTASLGVARHARQHGFPTDQETEDCR